MKEALLTHDLLIRYGFACERTFRQGDQQFTLKYSREGFDGQIDLYAQFSMPGFDTPEDQVEYGSSIEYLIDNSISTFHVYGGPFHIVSIETEQELLRLFQAMRCPLTG